MLPGFSTNFPDSMIRMLPVVANPIDQSPKIPPQFGGNWRPILVVQIHGIDQRTVNVELQLLVSTIPHSDRPRGAVALQVIQGFFVQVTAAIDGTVCRPRFSASSPH